MGIKIPNWLYIVMLVGAELLGLCMVCVGIIQLAGLYHGRDVFHLVEMFGIRAVSPIVMFDLVVGVLYVLIPLVLMVGFFMRPGGRLNRNKTK